GDGIPHRHRVGVRAVDPGLRRRRRRSGGRSRQGQSDDGRVRQACDPLRSRDDGRCGQARASRRTLIVRKRRPDASTSEKRIREALAELAIPSELVRRRGLPRCAEARRLMVAEVDARGRELKLTPAAARAWKRMKSAASKVKVELYLVSAFRSFDRQCEILRAKLAAGQALEEILGVSAPPGYSEHHTGRAVDIGRSPAEPL